MRSSDVRFAMITILKTLVRIDVAEHPKGSNRGEIVDRINILEGGSLEDPWCASTYAFAYKLGHDLAGKPYGYEPSISTSETVRRGKKAGKQTTAPKGGDAVCFMHADGSYFHTGCFNGWVNKQKGIYSVLEGNAGDRMQMRQHTTNEPATFISCE